MADNKNKKTVRLDEENVKSDEKKDEKLRKKLGLSLPLCPGRSLRAKKPSKGNLIFISSFTSSLIHSLILKNIRHQANY